MTLDLLVKNRSKNSRKITVELNADQFEKLAANFGLFNPDFIKSVNQAEKDFRSGRVKKVKSLKNLRR